MSGPLLHGEDAVWPETNCALDVWIQLLRLRGNAPEPAMVCAFDADCLADHWVMLKPDLGDLRRLYGIQVTEFVAWKPIAEHILDHLARGAHLTLETDAWWLPDAAGTSYRSAHVKTSIVPLAIDIVGRRLDYLHNAGRFTAAGDDFDGVLARAGAETAVPLPYLELISPAAPVGASIRCTATALLGEHLARRPADNPVDRLTAAVLREQERIRSLGPSYFHGYAFVTLRQLGTTGQVAAGFLSWLGPDDVMLKAAAGHFTRVAELAKSAQFALARSSWGRKASVDTLLYGAASAWSVGMEQLVEWHERASVEGRG